MIICFRIALCQTLFFTIQMENVKDTLNFCNAPVFYDFTNIGITVELNQVGNGII